MTNMMRGLTLSNPRVQNVPQWKKTVPFSTSKEKPQPTPVKNPIGKLAFTALAVGAMSLASAGLNKAFASKEGSKANAAVSVQAGEKEGEKQVITVTDVTFDRVVLKSNIPVVASFGAEWCGPCQAMKPELKKLANDKDLKDKIKVVKVDVDRSPNASARYGISSIPDTIFFKRPKSSRDNVPTGDRQIGYRNADSLKRWVEKYLDKK